MKCAYCEKEFDEEELRATDESDYVCEQCAEDEGFIECDDCGNMTRDYTEVYNGDKVCTDCIENYELCDECDEYCPAETVETALDQWGEHKSVCRDCLNSFYLECNHCGEFVHEDYTETDDNDIVVCNNCFNDYYMRCTDCECIIRDYDVHYYDDEPYCEDCYRQFRGKIAYGINDYDLKPTLKFLPSTGFERYYGVELEIDEGGSDDDNAEALVDISGKDIYCKHDGSINNGFEIVTHPATLEYHMNKLGWQDICSEAVDMGYRSHDTDTCGLHVHISRTAFGGEYEEQELNIAKLLLFFERNWTNIVEFTRRTEDALNKWAARYGRRADELKDPKKFVHRAKSSGRYFAVNLSNAHTVEIRVFKGTLKVETLLASIQFCDVLVDIVTSKTLEDMQKGVTFKDVRDIAVAKNYNELVNEIIRRQLQFEEIVKKPVANFKAGDYVKFTGNPLSEGIRNVFDNTLCQITQVNDEGVFVNCRGTIWIVPAEVLKKVPAPIPVGTHVKALVNKPFWSNKKRCIIGDTLRIHSYNSGEDYYHLTNVTNPRFGEEIGLSRDEFELIENKEGAC